LEYYEALDRRARQPDFPLIPLLIETAQPKIPFLNLVHWIHAADPTVPAVLQQLLAALRGERPAPITRPWLVHSPYKGLEALTEADADFFSGRTKLTGDILSRIAQGERSLTLVGNSGVGKSSLVRAGVIAALRRQRRPENPDVAWPVMLRDSRAWLFLTLTPGEEPVYALARAFVSQWTNPGDTKRGEQAVDWAESLRNSTNLSKLLEATKETLQESGIRAPQRVVLFIDQGEELYTRSRPEQASRFSEMLAEGSARHDVLILNTLRSDYYGRLQADEVLFKATARVDVEPVREEGLREIVVTPASALNVSFDPPDVTKDIVREAAEGPGTLPLLSFLLEDMWKRMQQRQDGALSLKDYRDLGGVKGVVQRRADAYLNLYAGQREKDATHRETVKRVFTLRLLQVPQEGEPVRRRVRRQECSEAEWAVIDELAGKDWRLLTTGEEQGEPTAQVAHEVLVRAWEQLPQWITGQRVFLVWKGQIEQARHLWEGKERDDGALLRGRGLDEALDWLSKKSAELSPAEREYINASNKHRIRGRRAAAAVSSLVLVLILGTTWLWQKGYSVEQAMLKVASLLVSIHVDPQMQTVAAGTFRQGDTHGLGARTEQPVHDVTVKSFAIGKFEMTFEEYDRFAIAMGRPLPGDQGWGRGRRPVINVSWHDAKDYAGWLSGETGKRFRLPTESEWEYAARSIEKNKDDIWTGTSEEDQLNEYVVYAANSQGRTTPVGSKKPNALGLHDMSGNVFEWVEDCVHKSYDDALADGSAWLEANGGNCEGRVIRGGSWGNDPVVLRTSNRFGLQADIRDGSLGFRLVQDIP
jgi:formylglycine-generating enzyme required for sulfatase activity